MTFYLLSLIGATATLFVYAWLGQHLRSGSMEGRRLDLAAFLSSVICMAFIGLGVWGGLDASLLDAGRHQSASIDSAFDSKPPIAPRIRRIRAQDLGLEHATSESVEELGTDPDALGRLENSGNPATDDDSNADSFKSAELGKHEVGAAIDDDFNADAKDLHIAGTSKTEFMGDPIPQPQATTSSGFEEAPGEFVIATSVHLLPTATRIPSIVLPPTPVPVPTSTPQSIGLEPIQPLVPTPECGDAKRMKVSLDLEKSRAERDGEVQRIHYRGRIENRSSFPVHVTGIVVTAQDAKSGSDQFGSARPADLRIAAGDSLMLQGAVRLEKFPSPFGRSELCIAFVADTCGQQNEPPLTRRCRTIDGF